MTHIEKDDICIIAGCGNDSVAVVPVVERPDVTDPKVIATAPMKPACGGHIGLLWNHYSSFGVLVLMNLDPEKDDNESARTVLQQLAAVQSIHDHSDSKAKVGFNFAAAGHGMALQVG